MLITSKISTDKINPSVSIAACALGIATTTSPLFSDLLTSNSKDKSAKCEYCGRINKIDLGNCTSCGAIIEVKENIKSNLINDSEKARLKSQLYSEQQRNGIYARIEETRIQNELEKQNQKFLGIFKRK